MNILPSRTSNNLFIKIKRFIINLFKKENQTQYKQEGKVLINENHEFQENLRVKIMENESIEKIDMQNRKICLLEKIARNTEVLKKLSMEELVQLQKMYDEELIKMTDVD